MTVEIKEEFGIEQAAHDISKAKELEGLAKSILTARLSSIKISCDGPYSGVYLAGIENESDDIPKEALAKFLDNQAARHRASAQQWMQYALQGE